MCINIGVTYTIIIVINVLIGNTFALYCGVCAKGSQFTFTEFFLNFMVQNHSSML